MVFWTVEYRIGIQAQKIAVLTARKDRWAITLYLQVADKFEFHIYLRHAFAKAVKAKAK